MAITAMPWKLRKKKEVSVFKMVILAVTLAFIWLAPAYLAEAPACSMDAARCETIIDLAVFSIIVLCGIFLLKD